MIRWDEKRLKELVRKMKLRRMPGQGKTPIHLSLYGSSRDVSPLLAKIMQLNTIEWSALGYDETDRISVVRYLGGLGCLTDDAMSEGCYFQHPLTPELAKALVDTGACDCDKDALRTAAYQQYLTPELVKLLIDAGCDPAAQNGTGWDSLVCLAHSGRSVGPQVTDLFLSAGCRTDLDGCRYIDDKISFRFDQILKEHTEWKEKQDHLLAENSQADSAVDWSR